MNLQSALLLFSSSCTYKLTLFLVRHWANIYCPEKTHVTSPKYTLPLFDVHYSSSRRDHSNFSQYFQWEKTTTDFDMISFVLHYRSHYLPTFSFSPITLPVLQNVPSLSFCLPHLPPGISSSPPLRKMLPPRIQHYTTVNFKTSQCERGRNNLSLPCQS